MNSLNKVITIFLLFIVVSINGCGLILSGSKDNLYIYSTPKGAKVYINGYYMGETPLPLTLKSDKDYIVEFRKEGYESKTKIINSSVAPGYIILDIVAAFVPIIIDAATGGWYTLDNDYCNVILNTEADVAERKRKQAEAVEIMRQKELEVKRNSLSSTDRDKIILEINKLKNDINKLEAKADSISFKYDEYINLTYISFNSFINNNPSIISNAKWFNKKNDSLRNESKVKMGYAIAKKKYITMKEANKKEALKLSLDGIKINNNISLLRIQLDNLYDLVPELRP